MQCGRLCGPGGCGQRRRSPTAACLGACVLAAPKTEGKAAHSDEPCWRDVARKRRAARGLRWQQPGVDGGLRRTSELSEVGGLPRSGAKWNLCARPS